MLYTYINRHAGIPDKNKHYRIQLNRFKIIYSNSDIDAYSIKAYGLEHNQCCYILYMLKISTFTFYNKSARTFYKFGIFSFVNGKS